MGLLYSQVLADRAQTWLSQPLNDRRSPDGLLELASIWAAIHQLPLPECLRQCQYSERCASVAAYLREFSRLSSTSAMSDPPQSQSQFAPQFANETLVHEDLAGPVTAANLTDETAEFFIKQGRKDLFVKRGAAEAADATPGEPGNSPASATANLEAEQAAHAATTAKLDKETEAHTKAADALKAEKEAHKATKKEVSELQKQVADLQKQLAKVADAADPAK